MTTFFTAAQNVCFWHLADIETASAKCPLSGVKQTSRFQGAMPAFDPKRTWAAWELR
jgi:hypothetical protein